LKTNHKPRPAQAETNKTIVTTTKTILGIFAISAALAAPASAQSYLTNGLVAYFPFEGNAIDASGNGHNGAFFGTTNFGVDRFGNSNSCLSLAGAQGIGSGVDVPSLDSLPYLPATYSAWFLITSFPPPPSGGLSVMTLVGREACNEQADGALVICSDPSAKLTNSLIYFAGGSDATTGWTPPTNKWCQLVLTLSSNGAANFYLDGTNLAGPGSASTGVAEDFRIGASGGSGCGYEYVWNGLIDDVRIYSRALSNAEIQELYQYEAVPCTSQSAVAIATVTNGFVIAAEVIDEGCGYSNAPLVGFQGGGGTAATALAVVSNGAVVAINITDAGSNYATAPTVIIGESPTITNQPQSLTVNAYGAASFSVAATGTSLFNYQWSLNGSNLAGATSSNLTFSSVVQSNLGTYTVVVSNVFGIATSSNALLSMYPYLIQPFNGLITDWGYTNTLNVQAWGTGPLTYQWYDNGTAIGGATNQNLILDSIQFTNAGLYSVVVTSPLGSVTNMQEQVVVNPAGISIGLSPTITISGVAGYNYIIQRTTDLSNTNSWITLTNLTLTQPVQIWADTSINTSLPGNPYEFYRILPGQ
jgi:hypothetical protein